jgi:hypothetical protein
LLATYRVAEGMSVVSKSLLLVMFVTLDGKDAARNI